MMTIKELDKLNRELCEQIQRGDRSAEWTLCERNKTLVDKCAQDCFTKYKPRLDIEDLLQVGYMGLIKAAKRFDMRKDFSFAAYAYYWVRQVIEKEAADYGYLIRVPDNIMMRVNNP